MLADFIECYWEWRGEGLSGRVDRLIPGGRVELIFNLGDSVHWLMDSSGAGGSPLQGVHIMGQRDQIYYCRPSGRMSLFGVRFRPGSFGAFSAIPLHLLLNLLLPASEAFGKGVVSMHERIGDAVDDGVRVRLVENWLCRALAGTLTAPVVFALDIIRSEDGIKVEAVCEQVGWDYKRMERAFLREVGYTPKAYSRVVRFNKAIRRMGGADSLTSVGYDCGYYDQAHFIKDFIRFAGMTPGQFRVEENLVAELLIRNQVV
jgi:AraC-like DNA-binding protein